MEGAGGADSTEYPNKTIFTSTGRHERDIMKLHGCAIAAESSACIMALSTVDCVSTICVDHM